MRAFLLILGLGATGALSACSGGGVPGDTNPAAPPVPPAEIPSFLTFPESVAINVDEIQPAEGTSALQAQVSEGGPLSDDIITGFEETELTGSSPEGTIPPQFKIDFADFDLDGDGVNEGCTGCTCPAGCDVECPEEADPSDLQPICVRVWAAREGEGNFFPALAGRLDLFPIRDDPTTVADESNPGRGALVRTPRWINHARGGSSERRRSRSKVATTDR